MTNPNGGTPIVLKYKAILPKWGNFERSHTKAIAARDGQLESDSVELEAECLDDVFGQLNHGSGRELAGYRGRSLSVGDVVVETTTGKAWMCDSMGWKELEP